MFITRQKARNLDLSLLGNRIVKLENVFQIYKSSQLPQIKSHPQTLFVLQEYGKIFFFFIDLDVSKYPKSFITYSLFRRVFMNNFQGFLSLASSLLIIVFSRSSLVTSSTLNVWHLLGKELSSVLLRWLNHNSKVN